MNKIRKFFGLLALSVAIFGCHKPEIIPPTTTAIGLNSVSAIFNAGKLKNDPSAKFTTTISSPDQLNSNIVINVPWFYPEHSNNIITDITNMRVLVSIDDNCFIEPSVNVLDLTKENHFTFTDGRGEKHKIVITGKIAKLSKCDLLSFSITNPSLVSVLNKENSTITISVNEFTNYTKCKVAYDISPHASCSLDGMETVDFSTINKITVTAHSGATKVYDVILSDAPVEKIPYGFRPNSQEIVWSVDMESLGMMRSAEKNVSLGVLGNNLIICAGNGDTPIYVNRTNGVKVGNISLGSAEATGQIENDEAGNLLICNRSNTEFKIWSTRAVDQSPTLLLSHTVTNGFKLGSKLSVRGDIKSNAIIVVPYEGIDGVSGTNEMVYWTVTGGVISAANTKSITGGAINQGLSVWGSAPANSPAFVPLSTNVSDGFVFSAYDSNTLFFIKGDDFTMRPMLTDGRTLAWAYNNNCMDVKVFNKARYTIALHCGHFPQWGGVPLLFLYDMTTLSSVTGTVNASPSLVLSHTCSTFYVTGGAAAAGGDVLLYPSPDGYFMNIYYIEHNNRIIESFQVDCIVR